MAIKRPQAIDAAPVRAGAQRSDGRAATFLSPRGMGEAQGKKVAASPLRQGDRGAALLWPDRVIDETAPSCARRPQGKVMRPWDHARAGVAPRENKKHRRTERRPDTAGPRLAAQCSHQSQSADNVGAARSPRNGIAQSRPLDRRTLPDSNRRRGSQDLQLQRKTERLKPRHYPPGGSGGICRIMRSQAVAPTTMDPNSANACCHATEGTPSCARPSVNI
jgi:hypothetical protein